MSEPDDQSPQEAGSIPPSMPMEYPPNLPSADSSADMVAERHLLVVRSRLIANLGNALASWFRIVPSDRTSGELGTVALLLEAHLPVLVPVNDLEAGPIFFMAQYDIDGHRLKGDCDREHMAAYSSLADALLAADTGFNELKSRVDVQRHERYPRISKLAAELPEERWLRHQLLRRMPAAKTSA